MLLEAWRSCGRRRKFIWSAPFKIPIDTRRRPLLKQLPAQRVYLARLDSQSQCQGQCQWQWQCQCQCYLSTHSPQAPMPLPLAVALPNPNVASYRSFLSSTLSLLSQFVHILFKLPQLRWDLCDCIDPNTGHSSHNNSSNNNCDNNNGK